MPMAILLAVLALASPGLLTAQTGAACKGEDGLPSLNRAGIDSVVVLDELEKDLAGNGLKGGAAFVDNQVALKKNPDFQKLREMMRKDWREVLAVTMRADASEQRRALVIVAGYALPPDEYRALLNELVTYAESGVITGQEMRWALQPGKLTTDLEGAVPQVWKNTWKDDETQRVVMRVRALFHKDKEMVEYCNKLLKGELEVSVADQNVEDKDRRVHPLVTMAVILAAALFIGGGFLGGTWWILRKRSSAGAS